MKNVNCVLMTRKDRPGRVHWRTLRGLIRHVAPRGQNKLDKKYEPCFELVCFFRLSTVIM